VIDLRALRRLEFNMGVSEVVNADNNCAVYKKTTKYMRRDSINRRGRYRVYPGSRGINLQNFRNYFIFG
jgi:23S rRNA A2030 N6-methylase RlmJ